MAPAIRALRRAYPALAVVFPDSWDGRARFTLRPSDVPLGRGGMDEEAYIAMIAGLSCDGAVFFTGPGESPYPDAYRCYLAGVPVRVGESCEFGGGVLSVWARPAEKAGPSGRYLALARALGRREKERRNP